MPFYLARQKGWKNGTRNTHIARTVLGWSMLAARTQSNGIAACDSGCVGMLVYNRDCSGDTINTDWWHNAVLQEQVERR